MTERSSRRFSARLTRSRWLSPVLLVLAWELGSRTGIIPAHTLAAPSAVLTTLWQMLVSGELPSNLAVSFARVAIGGAQKLQPERHSFPRAIQFV